MPGIKCESQQHASIHLWLAVLMLNSRNTGFEIYVRMYWAQHQSIVLITIIHYPFTVLQSVVMHIFLLILRFVVWPMRIIFISGWDRGNRQATLELWYISWLELLAAFRMEFLSSKFSRGFLRVRLLLSFFPDHSPAANRVCETKVQMLAHSPMG